MVSYLNFWFIFTNTKIGAVENCIIPRYRRSAVGSRLVYGNSHWIQMSWSLNLKSLTLLRWGFDFSRVHLWYQRIEKWGSKRKYKHKYCTITIILILENPRLKEVSCIQFLIRCSVGAVEAKNNKSWAHTKLCFEMHYKTNHSLNT